MLVVLLGVEPATAAAQIAAREPDSAPHGESPDRENILGWPGKADLIAHACALAVSMETLAGVDARIGTDGADAVAVAREIVAVMRARGLVGP